MDRGPRSARAALKHVQVREYVRSLVAGMSRIAGPLGARARGPVRRGPDDRAPGDGRAGRRGAPGAHPRQGHLRGPRRGWGERSPATPRRWPGAGCSPESHTLLARREQAGPAWPARSTSPRVTPSSTGSGCAVPTAPRCASRTPTSTRSCCPASCRAGCPRASTTPSTSAACDRPGPRTPSTPTLPPPTRRPSSRSSAGAPVLRHSRRALCGDKVVEVSRTAFRADRYTLWVQIGQDF